MSEAVGLDGGGGEGRKGGGSGVSGCVRLEDLLDLLQAEQPVVERGELLDVQTLVAPLRLQLSPVATSTGRVLLALHVHLLDSARQAPVGHSFSHIIRK